HASCEIDDTWPPIVTVLDRTEGPLFGATDSVVVPLPLPDEGPVMEIQGALLTAVHAHKYDAATDTAAVPPATWKLWIPGEMENVHGPKLGRCATPEPHVLFGI